MQRISAEGGKVARKLGQRSVLACDPVTHPRRKNLNKHISWHFAFDRLVSQALHDAHSSGPNICKHACRFGDCWICAKMSLGRPSRRAPTDAVSGASQPLIGLQSASFKTERGWRERRRVRMWLLEEAGEEWLQTSCLDTSCRITSSSSELFLVCFVFRTAATHISIVTNQDERCQSHITPSSQV